MVAGIRYRFRVIVNLVVGLGVGHDGGAGIEGGGGGDDDSGDAGVDGFEGVLEFRDHSLGDGAVGDHQGEIGTGYGRNHARRVAQVLKHARRGRAIGQGHVID